MNRIVIIAVITFSALFSIGLLLGLTAVWGLWDPTPERDIPSEEEVPSSLLINRANELPEVKAFRDRYGEPSILVDRTYGLNVQYSKSQCKLKGEPCDNDPSTVSPYSALNVWMDSNAKPVGIVLWCVDGKGNTHFDKIEHNIVERLKTDNENCI